MSRTCSVDSRNVVANVDISENIFFLCVEQNCVFLKGWVFFTMWVSLSKAGHPKARA